MFDDLYDGDTRLRNTLRLKIEDALNGFRAIYIQDSVRIIDCIMALDHNKSYLEAYTDPLYWFDVLVPLKGLVIGQDTGETEEVLIN